MRVLNTKRIVGVALILSILVFTPGSTPESVGAIPEAGIKVGATYYGGNYDENLGSWIVDNHNQCNRIRSGEFTAASLGGILGFNCNDDNGLSYVNDQPLHNTVSFAELSLDPNKEDYSALGNLPAGTKLEIQYNGRCLIAEKKDVGTGGPSVYGYQRALDLWWQTARSLDFKSGFDVVTVRPVDTNTPLTILGQSYSCNDQGASTGQVFNFGPEANQQNASSVEESGLGAQSAKLKKPGKKAQATKPGSVKNQDFENGQVLGATTIGIPPIYDFSDLKRLHTVWILFSVTLVLLLTYIIYRSHHRVTRAIAKNTVRT